VGAVISITLGLSNHKPFFDKYPLIILFAVLGYFFGRNYWLIYEKEYLNRQLASHDYEEK
jgi:hypothetical protein